MRLCAALLLLGFVPALALADTDYRCLHSCVNGGGTSTSCLEECSYAQAAPMAKSTHDVLIAPKPAGNAVIEPPKPRAKPEPSKDYSCLAKCTKDGLQYGLCEKRCAKPLQK